MELFQDIEYGYWGLFLASFFSATILPFSSEAFLLTMLLLGFDPVLVLTFATVGNWLGGITTYVIGYYWHLSKIERYFGIDLQKLKKARKWIAKYGGYTALISWVPFIGDILCVALGVFRVNSTLVILFMGMGKFLRYLVIMMLYSQF